MKMRAEALFCVLVAGCATSSSGTVINGGAAARDPASPPALTAITEADLRRDIFTMAGDEMRGREAGTLDELRASMWLADRAREAGLEPAGDDGTFFQFWPMRRTRLSDASTITVAGRPLQLWRDVVVTAPVNAHVDLPLAFVTAGSAADGNAELRGKAVVAVLEPP